jgi:hypothetical protein
MTFNAFYLNLIKFLTISFVLGFIAYVANANEMIPDHKSFSVCNGCLVENSVSNRPK